MGLRFRKSIRLGKGVRVNLGKKGASLSFGTKGLRYSIHTSGRRTSSVGIPGTGIYYTKSSSGRKKRTSSRNAASHASSARQTVQQQRLAEKQQNATLVEQYNQLIELLTGIHKQCDAYIDWHHIHALDEPFSPQGMGPREAKAIADLENYKPGFLAKIVKSLGEKQLRKLELAVDEARQQDAEEYEEWRSLHLLSGRMVQGDIDAYLEVIEEMKPLDDLLEYGGEFEFGTDHSSAMEVEFKVKSGEIIPNYSLSLTQTGRLSKKALTKTAYYELVQDYVCSCSIRIARDLFALLPVQYVVVHAVDQMLNPETGYDEEFTILSVLFERDVLIGLNFERIDPSEAMNNFRHQMKFAKTSGFKPVERIANY